MNPAKAIAKIAGNFSNGASAEQTVPVAAAPAITYDPVKVLETLKLLAGGNISDEQLDAYEENASLAGTFGG